MNPNSMINDLLYTWNPSPNPRLAATRIEDDIRDGIQGAFTRKPTLTEKKELLELSDAVGSYAVLVGFPAISKQEQAECRALVIHAQKKRLKVSLAFLARTLIADLEPIVQLHRDFPDVALRAEMYLGVSPLRRHIEGWNQQAMCNRLRTASAYLADNQTPFGFSLEDATRTPPDDLTQAIDIVLNANVAYITLCDTVGECTPAGATALTQYVATYTQANPVQLIWHGHNDKGLSVANAIAAAQAGVAIISGAFLGIGERSGNTPLEQIVVLLAQAGNPSFHQQALLPYCTKLAEYTQIPIAANAPVVGQQSFATTAGTHAAAILKAKAMGKDLEDLVFSGVSAKALGRWQDVLVGPTSGSANARYLLEQLGLTPTAERIQALLDDAKSRDRWLTQNDIQTSIAKIKGC